MNEIENVVYAGYFKTHDTNFKRNTPRRTQNTIQCMFVTQAVKLDGAFKCVISTLKFVP